MRRQFHAVVAGLLVLFAGCSSKPEDLIVGRWKVADGGNDTVQLSKDGTVTFEIEGRTATGKYKFESENVLHVTWESPQGRDSGGFQATASVGYVKVSKDELTMNDARGRSRNFKRAP